MVPAPRSFKASKTRHPGCGDLATSKDRTWEAPGGQGFTRGTLPSRDTEWCLGDICGCRDWGPPGIELGDGAGKLLHTPQSPGWPPTEDDLDLCQPCPGGQTLNGSRFSPERQPCVSRCSTHPVPCCPPGPGPARRSGVLAEGTKEVFGRAPKAWPVQAGTIPVPALKGDRSKTQSSGSRAAARPPTLILWPLLPGPGSASAPGVRPGWGGSVGAGAQGLQGHRAVFSASLLHPTDPQNLWVCEVRAPRTG